MEAKSVLVTGANRGLGLEFVKQFLKLVKPPVHVFAACRDPEKAEVGAQNKIWMLLLIFSFHARTVA